MNPTPSQSRIDIIIHDGDAEWWQIVAAISPLVILLGVILMAVLIWLTRQRRTDTTMPGTPPDWWERARWALEASLDDDPKKREVGLAALELLNASNLSGKEESQIIAEAWKSPLRDRETLSALAQKKSLDQSDSKGSISPPEERVIIRAARLRLSTDKKLGIESPFWVKEIAKRPL